MTQDHLLDVRLELLPKRERAGLWNGEYKAGPIADQEAIYMMDDHENDYWEDYTVLRYWPMKND